MRRRPRRASVAALLVAAAAAACTGSGDDSPDGPGGVTLRDGGTLEIGVIGEPLTLAPYARGASDLTWILARPVYPSLFRFAPDGTPVPYLAASADETGGVVRITLEEMRWSDGSAITAGDVAASARNATEPSGFTRFGRVVAGDDSTVELHDPPRAWREALATVAFVLPGGAASVDPPVGGGPWRVARYVAGLEVEFERNPEWAGEPPVLDRVLVQFVENLDIMLGLLREGSLDAAIPPSTVNLAQRLDEIGVRHASRLGWESIVAEFDPDTTSEAERIAVANAFDRVELIGGLMGTEGRVSDRLDPSPGPRGADGPWRELPAGGSPPAAPVGIAAAAGDEVMGLLERALYTRLGEAGIMAEFMNVPPRTFYGSWKFESPADVLLRRFLGAPSLSRARGGFDDVTALPLAHVRSFVAWRDGVAGFVPNPTIDGPLWNMARWGLVEE